MNFQKHFRRLPEVREQLDEQIILALTDGCAKTKKGLFKLIKKKAAANLTYGEIERSVKNLQKKHILNERQQKVNLSEKWMEELTLFVNKTRAKKEKQPFLDFQELECGTSITMSFENYMEVMHVLLENIDREQKHSNQDTCIGIWSHSWPITCISGKQYAQLQRVMKVGKHYIVIANDTTLDRILTRFWSEMGCKVQIRKVAKMQGDILVTQDKVVQIFMPKHVQQAYHSEKNPISKLYAMVYRNEPIKVSITKNGELADQIREETLKYFK